MLLVIMQEGDVVARIEDYTGPVPRQGDALFLPPLDDKGGTAELTFPGCNVMTVKSVAWGIIARPRNGEKHFVGRPEPMAEVWV